MRDIAHIADTFSTKGLDQQQIDLISRIRYIAHECLRDQVGGPIILSSTPQIELGKRVRGKERVRRKGTGKRIRKEDQLQYNAVSEDDQSHFCDSAIEVDHLQLHHMNREMEHPDLCSVDTEVDHLPLIHEVDEDDNMRLCEANIGVDHPDMIHSAVGGNMAQLSHADIKLDEAELCDAPKDVDDLHLPDTINEVTDAQICSAMDAGDPQHFPSSKQANDSQLYHSTEEVNMPKFPDTTNNVDNSELCHGSIKSSPQTGELAAEIVSESSFVPHEDIVQKGNNSVYIKQRYYYFVKPWLVKIAVLLCWLTL